VSLICFADFLFPTLDDAFPPTSLSHTQGRTESGREREREKEREKFVDNQIDDLRSVSTTPLQGDTAAGHSWPSIGGK
jgi:hypothetical protein